MPKSITITIPATADRDAFLRQLMQAGRRAYPKPRENKAAPRSG
jgi:hypothetical protein